MKFDEGMDFVQMRDGSSYVGKVTNEQFAIDTGLGKAIQVPTDKIVWIIFRNAGGYAKDRMQLKNASELSGTIQDKTVGFVSDATGPLDIPAAQVLAVQLLTSFGD